MLTDGIHASPTTKMWEQAAAVGWRGYPSTYITLDLKTNLPIAGLAYSTAAATRQDVMWPQGLLVLVSQDSNTWHFVGDLVSLALANSFPPATNGYVPYQFRTESLATHGRYVQLVVLPNFGTNACPNCFFAYPDEIEVYLGQPSFLQLPLPGRAITNVATFVSQSLPGIYLRRRLGTDLARLSQELNAAPLPGKIKTTLNAQIYPIITNIPGDTITPAQLATFSTRFPIDSVHQSIFQLQAKVWNAAGLNRIIMWQSNRWDLIDPVAMPVPNQPALYVPMMSNEYRADAFNLANCTQTNALVTLQINGLPGGVNPDYVTVQQSVFTDTLQGMPVAAALPLLPQQNGLYQLVIPPGLACQVWLSFHPTNVPAGLYQGQILFGGSAANLPVPLSLEVFPLQFPATPTLHLATWDYGDHTSAFDMTSSNRAALHQTELDHFVSAPWETYGQVLPTGGYDANGNMTVKPNPANLFSWLGMWPGASNYYVYGPSAYGTTFAGFSIGTAAWTKAVSNWITYWVGELAISNVAPNRLNFNLLDEPQTTASDNTIIQWANALKAAQPKVGVWEDPNWQNPTNAGPQLFQASLTLSCELYTALQLGSNYFNFYENYLNQGHRLWFYDASTRLTDPEFLRLQEWFCWRYGAETTGWWSSVDSGGVSCWNEYASTTGASTPFFLTSNSVTPGKQWEAIREGVEDYEYLVMLARQVAALEARGVQSPELTNAQQLLISAPSSLTTPLVAAASIPTGVNAVDWRQPKDRSVMDTLRLQILNILVQLSGD